MMGHITDYLQLIRIQLAGGMALPLIFAAISVNNVSLQIIVPLCIIGIFSGIYGFVLNDYFDIEVDKLSLDLYKRALVKGTVSKKAALIIIIFCFVGAYTTIFIFFYRNHQLFYTGLTCLIVAEVLAFIYNRFGKRIIASDFLIAFAQSLYFLFGALIVLESGGPGFLTWILFILIFNQLLYMNAVAGGLKDADHDYLMHVKNIALSSGVKVTQDNKVFIPLGFKVFGIGLRIFTAILVFTPFILDGLNYELWQITLLILLVTLLLYLSVVMLNIKIFARNKLRKLIVWQLFIWYCIVPVLFITLIGPFYAGMLIIIPVGWYILFSLLMGEKLFEPQI